MYKNIQRIKKYSSNFIALAVVAGQATLAVPTIPKPSQGYIRSHQIAPPIFCHFACRTIVYRFLESNVPKTRVILQYTEWVSSSILTALALQSFFCVSPPLWLLVPLFIPSYLLLLFCSLIQTVDLLLLLPQTWVAFASPVPGFLARRALHPFLQMIMGSWLLIPYSHLEMQCFSFQFTFCFLVPNRHRKVCVIFTQELLPESTQHRIPVCPISSITTN